MKKELDKNFNPSEAEDRIYKNWLNKGYFNVKIDKAKKPYTIVMPPPNITGQLHMGHALNSTIQDILIRTKRMQGYNALLLPGTDHASISTEVKVVEKLAKEGIKKEDIGREEFLKHVWDWKETYGNKIVEQFKKMGISCDWSRQRFTLDSGLNKAVEEVFIKLYKKGYIYKGKKLVNWCPQCKTTISDAEVNYIDNEGYFWYFKYPINGTNEFLTFATTRPETILGDTAIAVNPNDIRYKKYIGMTVTIPIVNRVIPIIADDYVEIDFGTGVVKITPAHDPNDFEVGERHNLPIINVMNDDGSINDVCEAYKGLDRYEAREKIVEEFKNLGLFVKKEEIKNSVGTHERCNCVIEPLIKEQWFVKMDEMVKPAIEEFKNNNLRFIPDRFGKIYMNWLENMHDWCISRQLWWGHRIPAYYCDDCHEIIVSSEKPTKCSKCGGTNIKQDEDTLDTWFSSALWPFSTLGWPENTEDLNYFYPTDVLVTAYDIIFFWVVRMVFSALEQTNQLPFKDVLIHGLVRDSEGRKMSKSLGNGINPLDVIEKYGTDALRLTLIGGNSPGNDQRFYWEKVEVNRNFLNKVWNATRFILMNLEEASPKYSKEDLTPADKWILSKLNSLIMEVTNLIDNYELGIAIQKIYDFIWEYYCDWYIEMVKPRLYNKNDPTRNIALWTLKEVLINSLKLLHPYAPFITEEIFNSIQDEEDTIVLSNWPKYNKEFVFEKEEKDIEIIKTAVKNIRYLRAEMNVVPSRKVKTILVTQEENISNIFKDSESFFKTLAYSSELIIKDNNDQIDNDYVSVVISGGAIYMPFLELVDIEKELLRLNKEKEKLESEVNRVNKKLSNEGFVSKAPQKLIEAEKEKQIKYEKTLEEVLEQIKRLSK